MSLINDALKKAQRQRTGDSPATHSPIPAPNLPPLRAPEIRDPNYTLMIAGGALLLGLVLGGGAYWLLRDSSGKSAAANPVATTTQHTQANSESAPAAPNDTKVASTEPIVAAPLKLNLATESHPESQTKTASSLAASASTASNTTDSAIAQTMPASGPMPASPAILPPAPAANETVVNPAAIAKATTPPEPSEQMVKAIESFRVMGIRAAGGSDAKVLMNDRVYRIGDLVDRSLGIRLTGATTNALTFQDATGASYTRNF